MLLNQPYIDQILLVDHQQGGKAMDTVLEYNRNKKLKLSRNTLVL